jgi:hypothetical protein
VVALQQAVISVSLDHLDFLLSLVPQLVMVLVVPVVQVLWELVEDDHKFQQLVPKQV